jgi:hypothetical protein
VEVPALIAEGVAEGIAAVGVALSGATAGAEAATDPAGELGCALLSSSSTRFSNCSTRSSNIRSRSVSPLDFSAVRGAEAVDASGASALSLSSAKTCGEPARLDVIATITHVKILILGNARILVSCRRGTTEGCCVLFEGHAMRYFVVIKY